MPNIAIIKHWMDKAEVLEKELAEKDAMIDWLAANCEDFCDSVGYCNSCILYPTECPIVKDIQNRFFKYRVSDWRKAAQEAVKKNEG